MRAVELDDAQFLSSLINDPQITETIGAYSLIYPVSIDEERKWILQTQSRTDEKHMIIEMIKNHSPIGIITLKNIDKRNASAHLGLLIGQEYWDKGYGTEAIIELLETAFEKMNMRRIWLRVDEENARAIRCYEKCGFVFEGVLRQDHIKDGEWKSSLIMSILRHEFERVKI